MEKPIEVPTVVERLKRTSIFRTYIHCSGNTDSVFGSGSKTDVIQGIWPEMQETEIVALVTYFGHFVLILNVGEFFPTNHTIL